VRSETSSIANGILGVEVEILHLSNYFRPSLFTILPSHLALLRRLWRYFRNESGRSGDLHLFFDFGRSKDKAMASIVVTVTPRAVFDWSQLRNEIPCTLGL
jgi:hypothetical protein